MSRLPNVRIAVGTLRMDQRSPRCVGGDGHINVGDCQAREMR